MNESTGFTFETTIFEFDLGNHDINDDIDVEMEDGNMISTNHTTSASGLMDHQVAWVLQLLFMVVLSGLVSIAGIVTNVINIVVFVRQGAHQECGLVNLLGLAVSDLCVVLTMLYTSVGYIFLYVNPPNLPWNAWDLVYLTGGWPHLASAQITRLITAYVAFERCVCVVFPFKVKTWLSPKRSIAVIVGIFGMEILAVAPVFFVYGLDSVLDPSTNVSRVTLVSTASHSAIEFVLDFHHVIAITFNFGSVAVVCACSFITVSHVQLSKAWRSSIVTSKGSTGSSGSTRASDSKSKPPTASVATVVDTPPPEYNTSTKHERQTIPKQKDHQETTTPQSKMQKEKKLITMMLLISGIFLICFIPDVVYFVLHTIEPEINPRGKYGNLALVLYSVVFLAETFNSSINIVVYWRMSSRYKEILHQLFPFSSKTNKAKQGV